MSLVSLNVRLFLSLLLLLSLLLFLSSASVASFSVVRGAGARRGGTRPEATTTAANGPGTSASLPPHWGGSLPRCGACVSPPSGPSSESPGPSSPCCWSGRHAGAYGFGMSLHDFGGGKTRQVKVPPDLTRRTGGKS